MSRGEIRNITDVITIDYLHTIQNNLSVLAKVSAILLDSDGVLLSAPKKTCTLYHAMPTNTFGKKICPDAYTQLIENSRNTQLPTVNIFPNLGLKIGTIPIFLDSKFIGSWLVSQTFNTPAEKSSTPNPHFTQVVSDSQFDNAIGLIKNITLSFTKTIESNISLNEQNTEFLSLTNELDSSLHAFKEFIDNTSLGAYLTYYHTGELIMYNNIYSDFIKKTSENSQVYDTFEAMHPISEKHQLLDELPHISEQYNPILDKWLCITSRALYWIDGNLAIMTTFFDITKYKKETEQIKYLAYNDPQLGIPNDVKLNLDLKDNAGTDSYLICLNIKGLKETNGVYGREIGDNLLHKVVSWIHNLLDDKYVLYRIVNNDFAILVKNGTQEIALSIANAIYNRFDAHWVIDLTEINHKIFSSAHVGTFQISDPTRSHSALINVIEKVLLFARRENKPILFDATMDEEYVQHTRLVVSLKSCVLNNMEGFSLNYQPVVHSDTGKWTDVEALCRWESPELGIVPPDIFIEKAEQIGIIDLIGDWVLEKAICQTKDFGFDKIPDFSLSVNISPLQLSNRRLLPKILDLLTKYDYPISKLNLEITESVEVHFDSATMKILNSIRDAGISLSLDDFGIGYATFSSLRDLPVNVLKIDRSFINGIENNEYIQRTMQVMVEFAHSAGLTVTVEGIETQEQYEIINLNGVSLLQGFYFSKPLTVEILAKNIDNFK